MKNNHNHMIYLVFLSFGLMYSCSGLEDDSTSENCISYNSYEINRTDNCYIESTKEASFCLSPRPERDILTSAGCFINIERNRILFSDTLEHAPNFISNSFVECNFDSVESNISSADKCLEKETVETKISSQSLLARVDPSEHRYTALDPDGISEGLSCEEDGCYSDEQDKEIYFDNEQDYLSYLEHRNHENETTNESYTSNIDLSKNREMITASIDFPSIEKMNNFVLNNQRCIIIDKYDRFKSLTVACSSEVYKEIINNDDILSINEDESVKGEQYNGNIIENSIRSSNYEQYGYDGETGGRVNISSHGGNDIKIAIIEAKDPQLGNGTINCNHVGWKDCYNCSSRIRLKKDCFEYITSWGFPLSTCNISNAVCDSTSGSNGSHGTKVAWVAAGSIEQGQDNNISSSNDRSERSGVADESSILYYRHEATACVLKKAIDTAINDGADVINISSRIPNTNNCDPSENPCGLNSAISSAFDAGVLIVKSAGNGGNTLGCSVTYPGVRRDLLTVGALSTIDKSGNVATYNNTDMASTSSKGYAVGSWYQGGNVYVPLVDLVAPGDIISHFSNGTNQYSTTQVEGTSFAAPAVAALVGLTREWSRDIGWTSTPNEAGLLAASALLYGDGFNSISSPDNCSTINHPSDYFIDETISSYSTGYGRVKAHFSSPNDMGNGHTWKTRSTKVYQGGTVSWNVGSSSPDYAHGFKASLIWRDSDFQNIPKIQLSVYNTCPSGGGEELVKSAHLYAMRQRLILYPSEINGKCLQVRVKGLNVPPGGVDFWAASYTWTNNSAGAAHLHFQDNIPSGTCF